MIKDNEATRYFYEKEILPYEPKRMPYDFLCVNEVLDIQKRLSFKVFLFRYRIEHFIFSICERFINN